jgi:hypothetical protein
MVLKWKYSQLLASIGFDHSGGCPSIGQTFLCSALPPQPQTAIRPMVKKKLWKRPFGVVTLRIFSDGAGSSNVRALRRRSPPPLINAVTVDVDFKFPIICGHKSATPDMGAHIAEPSVLRVLLPRRVSTIAVF